MHARKNGDEDNPRSTKSNINLNNIQEKLLLVPAFL